jgi:N-acetylglucosamine kinase-like BadF-type ATPase
MLLVADSGSTKCDWILVKDDKVFKRFSTMGFNPYFHNEAVISGSLRRKHVLAPFLDQVKSTYFYGAGCSSDELRAVIERALYSILPNSRVIVDHDLVAAAYSTYSGTPGIACILGTGSNSCYFDGSEIIEAVPALAYILGDEGSGAYYGKKLLADFLYKRLPKHIHDGLIEEYALDKDTVMENVYMKPHANVYLASFMRFVWNYREDAYVTDMVHAGMKTFLETHVCCYDQYREVPTHLVGSIAHHFRPQLDEAAAALGVQIGTVDKKPINGLVRWHLTHQESPA